MRWLAVTCLLAVGLLTASSSASSPAHYPASNGWIVFASDRDSNSVAPFRLYRLEPIGGGVEPLGQVRGRQPVWSPDGSLIAFVDARLRLVVAGADGFRSKTLTSGRYPVQNPSWSPDGSRIVVEQSGRGRSRGDLVIVATNGSGSRRITRSRRSRTRLGSERLADRVRLQSSPGRRRRL
jgi:Tol biopolymer transport system component